jgi:hypothetical protein
MEQMVDGSKKLEEMQAELTNVQLIIIDEFRQAFPASASESFGGRSVMLTGDLCQLNPASGAALFAAGNSRCRWSQTGGILYTLFRTVFFLNAQVRQAADPEFGRLLHRVREGRLQESDWQMLMTRRSACSCTARMKKSTTATPVVCS